MTEYGNECVILDPSVDGKGQLFNIYEKAYGRAEESLYTWHKISFKERQDICEDARVRGVFIHKYRFSRLVDFVQNAKSSRF